MTKYSDDFKAKAVARYEEVGATKADVSKEFGISPRMLSKWVKTAAQNAPEEKGETTRLTALIRTAEQIGDTDSNYIGKIELMRAARRFAPKAAEVPLLLRHLAQVYAIFIFLLLYTAGLSFYLEENPGYLLPLVEFTFSWQMIPFFVLMAALLVLLYHAQRTDQAWLGFVAIVAIASGIAIPTAFMIHYFATFVIIEAFVLTSIVYGGSALFGLLTKSDLTGWGEPLFGSLLALVILGFFQMYFQNSWFAVLLLIGDIVLFTIYSMYDNQMIKIRFLDKLRDDVADTPNSWRLLAMSGALDIFLDFWNLFLDILSLLGNDDDD